MATQPHSQPSSRLLDLTASELATLEVAFHDADEWPVLSHAERDRLQQELRSASPALAQLMAATS